jgi:hypothetical protein
VIIALRDVTAFARLIKLGKRNKEKKKKTYVKETKRFKERY